MIRGKEVRFGGFALDRGIYGASERGDNGVEILVLRRA
jgi:hypothetical protein